MSGQVRPAPGAEPSGISLPCLPRGGGMGLTLREQGDADLPFLKGLYRSTRDGELALTSWSEVEKQAFIDMQFKAQTAHYLDHYPAALWLVIERAGAAIGRLYLERWPQEHRIIDIALLPGARGHGIGSALLKDLGEEASGLGRAVGIHVEKQNPAMALYKRLGFETIEDKGVYDLLTWRPDRIAEALK